MRSWALKTMGSGQSTQQRPNFCSLHMTWWRAAMWESTGCHHTWFFKGVWHRPSPPTARQTGALRCQRQSSSMDWVLPDWTYTISTCRWCTVEGGGSDVRCSPRYRLRTTLLYPLHKWPPSPGALSNTLPPLCGWLLAVPCHSFCSRPNPTPRWP